ncbi:MAG: serine/threonine-protein kinase [Myxococcota bacterium]
MSARSGVNESPTRVIVDGDETLGPGEPRDDLGTAAQRLFRPPVEPIVLSRYILLEPLGQGAFGAVYAAYDPELNRKVAIKLLVPRQGAREDTSTGRERLLREAQAMAHFSHPNVVAIYDVGTYSLDASAAEGVSEVAREGIFLVMELVDGQRFDHWARARKRSWREIVAPAIEAARGLAAAHQAGLVHRDFKPANVLVSWAGHPKILDFGLARLHGSLSGVSGASGSRRFLGPSEGLDHSEISGPLRSSRSSKSQSASSPSVDPSSSSLHEPSDPAGMLGESLTRTGTILGTPRYMAPELLRGEEAQGLSDQYAFCVTLYELLYGGPPWSARKIAELTRLKLQPQQARPPSSDVPAWLFRVLRRGMAPHPLDRFIDMHALIDALGRDPARQRRQITLGLGMIAAVVGVSAAAVGLGQQDSACQAHASDLDGVWDRSQAERVQQAFVASTLPHADKSWRTLSVSLDAWADAWVEQRVALCEAARQPDGPLAEEQGPSLTCLERHRRHVAGLVRVLGDADHAVVEAAGLMASELESPQACARLVVPSLGVGRLIDDGPVAEVEEAVAQARALMVAQKGPAALQIAQRAAEQAEQVGGEHLRARARLALAGALLGERKADQARDEAQQAIERAERVGDDELACEGMVLLFRALADGGDLNGANLVARLAASRAEAAMVGDRVASTLAFQQGALRVHQGRYAEAHPYLQRARQLRVRLYGPGHPLVAQADNGLGVTLYRDGRRDEALEAFGRAIAGFEAALGPDHPRLAAVYNNLGNFWMAAGRYDEAYANLTRSADINVANFPPDHLNHALAHHNLAMVAEALGERHKALRHYERAEQVRRIHLGEEHPDVLRVRSLRARLLKSMGRGSEARALMEQVLRVQQSVLGAVHHETLDTSFALASTLVAVGDSPQGVRLAEQALAEARGPFGGSDELGRWLVNMAQIYLEVERFDDATQAVTEAFGLLRFDSGESSPLLSQAYMLEGDLALAREDYERSQGSFSTAIELITGLFGPAHGRLVWPLRRRAVVRLARGDHAGARADLERAVHLSEDYDGPPMQRPRIHFALARVLPPSEAARAVSLVARARSELGQVAQQKAASVAEIAELEAELDRWEASAAMVVSP